MRPLCVLMLFLMLALPRVTWAESTVAVPDVAVQQVVPGIYLLQGKGGNVLASLGDDGLLIVDDDYAELAPSYARALAALSDGEVVPRYVVNTHWHSDHSGGNGYWGEQGSVIVAHDNVYQRMSSRQEIEVFDMLVEPSPRPALPEVTFDDAINLRFNGEVLAIQHYPRGHTDGDSVVYFVSQNVVHMGDHFFRDAYPFVDLSSGGSVQGYLLNVRAVLARIDDHTAVVPGHGALATKADLQRFADMIEATSAIVRQALADGRSTEEIIEAGLGERWQSWGQGFIDEALWIQTIAASVPETRVP